MMNYLHHDAKKGNAMELTYMLAALRAPRHNVAECGVPHRSKAKE